MTTTGAAKIAMRGAGYYSSNTVGAKAVIDKVGDLVVEAIGRMPAIADAQPFSIADFGAADGGTSIDLMRRMVEAIVAGRPIPRASIDAINALIGKSSGVTKVVKTRRKFERRFEFELNQPKQLLVPLAESAADLLCRGDFSRLKRCDNSKCLAFFYDTSKNRMRRWCSGAECGNRMRVAAFYQRQHHESRSGISGKR